jgi:D-alanyl-lipoteichoic acid acyltransferase DltB (MBOAT superfamily)
MLFNSFEFLLFFPLAVGIYFLTPGRYRWAWLLAASYYFYAAWKAEYLVLILASTLIDYWSGLQMGKHEVKERRRPYLILSLLSNLGLLFAFKYFNFFNESIRAVFDAVNIFYGVPMFDVLLPVGISFYTFQTLSYAVDVYRGDRDPERHLGIFALYVSFFPQLVAGPIERSTRLIPQFHQTHAFDWSRLVAGLQLMLWGFFMKVVVADRLAIYVNEVYNNPEAYTGVPVILATYFFAFQIFGDFAGYSLIAIGTARIMGIDLMENFRRPYFSKSIGEFWNRWHISLSSWFRDYLYIPLGGNRVVKWRWYYNLVVVFLVSGLWHGAAWTFVIWGALHGLYLIAGVATKRWRDGVWERVEQVVGVPPAVEGVRTAGFRGPSVATVRRLVSVGITFHLVLLAWVFFRANSLPDALVLLEAMTQFDGAASLSAEIASVSNFDVALSVSVIGMLLTVQMFDRNRSIWARLAEAPRWVRWGAYQALLLAIFLLGVFSQQQFIYFQF